MIALDELHRVRKSLILEQTTLRKNIYNTESYAVRLKSSLKLTDERLKKVNAEITELKQPERR